jgi:hypothetical protein
MDLSLLAAETTQGATMQVYHPKTGKPIEGMTSTIRSFQHETVQAVIKRQQMRANMKVGRDGKPVEPTKEEVERNAVELYDVLIEDWTGFELNGKKLVCDAANKRMIVSDEAKRWDWYLRDVLSFAAEGGNYFRDDEPSGDVAEASRVAAHKAGKAETDAS